VIPGQSVGTHRPDREESEYDTGMRNRRSVWTVPTVPYSGAHFATFPPALIEPCILAGSRTGDVVLDPFFGSGTTGQVAQALGRQWIGCELNEEYAPLQQERTAQSALAI
jgi:DNA modification methylase